MTKIQKIKFLEGIWIICWGKKTHQTKTPLTLLLVKKSTSKNCSKTSLRFTCSTMCTKKTHSKEHYSPSLENQTKLEPADRDHEEYV